MMQCHIALGGNIGFVDATMQAAVALLHAGDETKVMALSRIYRTAPVGPRAGAPFLNSAIAVETSLDPVALLKVLHQIERRLGRAPGDPWSGRPIDLDLLLCGSLVVDEPHLHVPHPHLWYRRFVLDPLADIAADVIHPLFGESIQELRRRLMPRPLTVAVLGGCAEDRLAIGTLLRQSGIDVPSAPSGEGPLRLAFVDCDTPADSTPRVIELRTLPGSPIEAAEGVLTAVLDEPQVQSLPLWRMP